MTAASIDDELHGYRLRGRTQRRHDARLGDLPDGTFVALPGVATVAFLVWQRRLHPWCNGEYDAPCALDSDKKVLVLTPRPTVAVLESGYIPLVNLSGPNSEQ